MSARLRMPVEMFQRPRLFDQLTLRCSAQEASVTIWVEKSRIWQSSPRSAQSDHLNASAGCGHRGSAAQLGGSRSRALWFLVDGNKAMKRCSPLAFLTTARADGINANMKADLVHQEKRMLRDGSIVEMVIWRVPTPLLGSAHSYKYRLYFGREGKRVVGFDNERGKGDHRHLDGVEQPYVFSSVETLVQDFLSEIDRRMPE